MEEDLLPNVTAFVPIKMESERVPGKNIRMLAGKPLCHWILETLLSVKSQGLIDRVCVFCSDPGIIPYLPAGVEFIKRSPELDKPEVEGMTIYQSFRQQVNYGWLLLCHTTSPFLSPKSIIKALRQVVFKSSEGINRLDKVESYDSAMSVARLQTFSWFERQPLNYNPSQNIPRTQNIAPVIWETSGFYLFHVSLLNSNTRIGRNPLMIPVTGAEKVDIDTEEDWELAEAYAYNITRKNQAFESLTMDTSNSGGIDLDYE